jgi:hypothetical protein
MAKFLVLARPAKPLPEGANIERALDHLQALRDSGRAEIYTLIEDDGYGFAILIDVADHDELMGILFENPFGRWGEYQVLPLGTLEGERRAMENIGIL